MLASAVLLLAFALLAIGNVLTTSATPDETVHLASGYAALQYGDHRMNPEHPPLLKAFAALPLIGMPLVVPPIGEQWMFAHEWLYGLHERARNAPTTIALERTDYLNDAGSMMLRGRLMMLIPALALGVLLFVWSSRIWGAWGGFVSVALFAFDPNFIAHSGLVTTDVGAALLLAAAVHFFWRLNLAGFCAAVALAQVAKFSGLLLIPIVLVLLIHHRRQLRRAVVMIVLAAAVSLVVIWAAYGFRAQEGLPLRQAVSEWNPHPVIQASVSAAAHVLPEAYVHGLVIQQLSSRNRNAYLRGSYTTTGFRSYFLWTTLYKLTVPALLVLAAGVVAAVRRRDPSLPFLLWPAAIYLAAAMLSPINIGHRHILPVFPFLYVAAGCVGRTWRTRTVFAVAGVLLVTSNLAFTWPLQPVWNRHLSYINELGGGPRRGAEILADSNLDWGQDLPRLADWLRERKIAEPVNLVWFGAADPQFHGVRYVNLPPGYFAKPEAPLDRLLVPGYLAISANNELGLNFAPADRPFWRNELQRLGAVRVGSAGYSIVIYRIDRRPSS